MTTEQETKLMAAVIGIALLVMVGLIAYKAHTGPHYAKAHKQLMDTCKETDLRVYVGGRVGEVLTIYDCGTGIELKGTKK